MTRLSKRINIAKADKGQWAEAQERNRRDLLSKAASSLLDGVEYRVRVDVEYFPDPMRPDDVVCESTLTAESAVLLGLEPRIVAPKQAYLQWPKGVIFNAPATIVFWDDGTKTVVKLMDGEEFNPEVGLAMCFCKKVMGDGYKRWFKDALKKGRWQ